MHTKHEGKKEEGVISMVVTNGLFIVGKMIGGNKLCDPRVFLVIENGKKIQLSPLPSAPPFITIGSGYFHYAIPEHDRNLLDLYDRVTHPEPMPPMPDDENVIRLN